MKIEIKKRFDTKIIFSGDYGSLKECVVDAVKRVADLTGADLRGADLTGADLTRADLTGADLTRANLTRANLTGANLTVADMYGAKNVDAYFQFGPVGSRKAILVYNATKKLFTTGCFSGTEAKLRKQLKETHSKDEYYKPYLIAIKSLKALAKESV